MFFCVLLGDGLIESQVASVHVRLMANIMRAFAYELKKPLIEEQSPGRNSSMISGAFRG